ncbi:MAG TPA: dTDP-4-dehydrorhamnose reductase [Ignavibacteriaceae bacterium]|nr:dTDP-4-dehydrorhamnose reductase [Ignavibacteriaceae bacterium]
MIKKRILIVGSNGMLGQRLINFFKSQNCSELLGCSVEKETVVKNIDYVQCDITKRDQVKSVIFNFYPDFIINAAAYTNVDQSETDREIAWKINVKGVEYLAEASRVLDAHLIHISSDYIFDGTKGPYSETAKPNPVSYYGRTKLASENALKISGTIHSILRTNVLFGRAEENRPDFVRWVVKMLGSGETIRIVTDQINNPTFVGDLVQGINKVIDFRKEGIYNIGGRDFLSRYDFTMEIAEFFKLDKNLVKPILTEELKQPAKRPLNSGLITLKAETELGFIPHSIKEVLSIMKRELSF